VAVGQVYRIVSTGRIAVMQTEDKTGQPLVDARGMPRGRYFQAAFYQSMNAYMFVAAYEPCRAAVCFRGMKIYEHESSGGEAEGFIVWVQKLEADKIKTGIIEVRSTGDVSVTIGLLGLSPQFIGKYPCYLGGQVVVPAGVEYKFVVPGGGVVFAPQGGRLEIDGAEVDMAPGQYLELTNETVHVVKADKPVIVQVRGTEGDDGFYALSDKDAVFYSPPKPSQKKETERGAGLPMEAVIGVAAAAAVAVALVIVKRRASS